MRKEALGNLKHRRCNQDKISKERNRYFILKDSVNGCRYIHIVITK